MMNKVSTIGKHLKNLYRLYSQDLLKKLEEVGYLDLRPSFIDILIFICENVFNIYLDADDYYEAVQEELEDGWICLLRAREHVLRELREYQIDPYFYWSGELDDLRWRKLKPQQLYQVVAQQRNRLMLD